MNSSTPCVLCGRLAGDIVEGQGLGSEVWAGGLRLSDLNVRHLRWFQSISEYGCHHLIDCGKDRS